MMRLSCVSFCRIATLISSLILFITDGEKVVAPGNLVHKLQTTMPEIEYYAKLQIRLEDIADESNMYKRYHLVNSQSTQKVLEKCKQFHQPVLCGHAYYRNYDGLCNNLRQPTWGKAITEQSRLLPANYEGMKGLRKSVSGQDLPSPRHISLQSGSQSNFSNSVSALFTFFGQFLTHDVVLTPVMTENGNVLKCCGPQRTTHPGCSAAFDYPTADPFFSRINVTCQNFVRAAPFPKCNLDKRGIINKKTSFIDASNVYDNSDDASYRLRTNDGTGKLRTQYTLFGTLMPKNQDVNATFCPFEVMSQCFEGGDDRINQHTMLTSLQTLFVRIHNRIANYLFKLNSWWDDETIFQEARRISIGIYQLIVYKEYLPYLIGPDYMEIYDLHVHPSGRSLYNDEVNPSIIAEFSTAAFRVHSMTSTCISSYMPRLKFRDTYSNLRLLHEGQLDPLLAGSSEVPSEQNDSFSVDDVSKFTYKLPGATFGSDLISTDLQRGRDAGLATYVDMVKMCSKGRIRLMDFWDLHRFKLMSKRNILALEDMYEDVRDVDLISGIYRELPVVNGEVGPTAACIVATQFHRLKFGDSFFVTHRNGRYPLTPDQLAELQKWSLARLLCETTRLNQIRLKPFTLPNIRNPLVHCRSFPPMNFEAWKDTY